MALALATQPVLPYAYFCNLATLVDYGCCFDRFGDAVIALLLGTGW